MKEFLELTGNYFFPMLLSVYLIVKVDRLFTQVTLTQEKYLERIFTEIKDIKRDILNLHSDKF